MILLQSLYRSVKTGGVDIVVEEAGMNRYANGEL